MSAALLGIDTGGTYTDAVLFREQSGVIAKAKALTTRHDLSIGIAGAVAAALSGSGIAPEEIGLVSLSTTLATNALVEGQGGQVCLVMIGFAPEDLARDGLAATLGNDPVIFLPGGHDVHGNARPLDLASLEDWLGRSAATVSAFAVAGYFAVRNPAHELEVRALIRRHLAAPVTCSHELSARLGGPRRALTTLLNARLIGMVDRLIGACETYLAGAGIRAPMMVVRGDGALIAASEARARPIETILSGPAASLVGARYLTGLDDAVVSDIGGTTTDIAVLEAGRPRLDADGAVVGGHRTMVEAVAMRTFGLGGDSEVHIDERGLDAKITLGPRRLIPLSLGAALHGNVVLDELERQLKAPVTRQDGRFVLRAGLPESVAAALSPRELALYADIGDRPMPLHALPQTAGQRSLLDRLVKLGLVQICGLTPSDALHHLGNQSQWNREAASRGLRLAARIRDGAGRPVAASPDHLAAAIVDRLTRQSAEVILATAFAEDGLADIDPARSLLISRALDRRPGIARFSLALDRPLVGLGASAAIYYPAIAAELSAEGVIPADADVANALGAVVGQVRVAATVLVTSPQDGVFILTGGGGTIQLSQEDDAIRQATVRAEESARAQAARNGLDSPTLEVFKEIVAPEIEGQRRLIEARIVVTASGRPRLDRPAIVSVLE